MARDVARELLLEPGLNGQRDKDVASTASGRSDPAVVEEKSAAGVGAWPVGTIVEPDREARPQLWVGRLPGAQFPRAAVYPLPTARTIRTPDRAAAAGNDPGG